MMEALGEPIEFSKSVVRNDRLQPAAHPSLSGNPDTERCGAEGTPAMQRLVDTARDVYDLVVIETLPMAAVVDFKVISRQCNAFIFVSRVGKITPSA